MKKENNKNIFMWVLLVLVLILILLFPKIHDFIEKAKLPKVVDTSENKPEEEVKVIDDDVLETIHYPKMRSSIYNTHTYYSLDKFTISDLSNSDILLNAFLDIYEGNITNYNGRVSCTSTPKQFQKSFIELRIRNILGKDLDYTLEDFYVPEDADSSFVGNWTFDRANGLFIYKGLCKKSATTTTYHDLEQLISIDYSGNDIVAYYYVGFAKVEGSNYTIYSDADMQKVISTGTLSSTDELDDIFKSISNLEKKTYKYTFKDSLCKYNDYCLYKGEWTDEL